MTFFNSRWYGCSTNFYLIFSHVFNRFKITESSRLTYTSSMVWVLIVFLHYPFPKQEIRQKAITNDNFHWQFCPLPNGPMAISVSTDVFELALFQIKTCFKYFHQSQCFQQHGIVISNANLLPGDLNSISTKKSKVTRTNSM